MKTNDFLVEIGTEELPPRALKRLAAAFEQATADGLRQADLAFAAIKGYAAPRRLALLVTALASRQPDKDVERRGPALSAAFGEDGCPSKAAQGFAGSCGVSVEELDKLETDKGSWLVFRQRQTGKPAAELIPGIIQTALDKLPIPRRMRWADLDAEFVRPVHWVVLLLDEQVVEASILGVKSGRESRGHRFHHPATISIPQANEYEVLLESRGKVIADFQRRRETIRAQVEQAALQLQAEACIDEDLLDEVTAMVEWPVAVTGRFDARFLKVPQEALISTMKANQKYFHLLDKQHKLLPYFITISNIESKSPEAIVQGNERVIRPRFADAEFFWNQDRKQSLYQRLDSIKTVIFQQQLGSLYDKTRRVAALAEHIATRIGADKRLAVRAAELCKCDLMTAMVGEFPELQGIMGRYYARHDGEPDEVAVALDDYYQPRFAGDALPAAPVSQALALADRLDTLLGIFAIGQLPSGDKDPFALRRAALGVLRIVIEGGLDLDLRELLERAAQGFDKSLKAGKAVDKLLEFILDRLHAYYQDQSIRPDVLEAVTSNQPSRPLDIDKRLHAVNHFRQLPEAESLASANKRIANILKKIGGSLPNKIDTKLLKEPAEQQLYAALTGLRDAVAPLLQQGDYQAALAALAQLRAPVDSFFDHVMVMADDVKLRDNRVALLNNLQQMFLQIADISKLQG